MGLSSQGARIGTQYPLSRQITVGTNRLRSQDIGGWTAAVNAARDPNFPQRRLLYELYSSIILDGHLSAVLEKRKIAITNQKIHWEEKGKEGERIEVMDDSVLHTPWFNDMIGYAMDAIAWGHSLIELVPEKGKIVKSVKIDPANVIPELGFMLYNYYSFPAKNVNGRMGDFSKLSESLGIYYREDKQYSDYLIEVGGEKDYGRLMSAAQYVIYKRGGFGDWSQFAELFGMPFRVGKYNPYDPNSRTKLEQGLSEMGSAAWAVIPDGSSIEFKDANDSGKSEVFKDLINLCNEEMSKLILGNTLTTAQGDKGARSLGDVHKDGEEEINVSDMMRIEYMLNWEVKNKLLAHGYPVSNGRFFFPETSTIPLEKRILIDTALAKAIPMSPEYFYKTYGVDKPKEGEIPVRISADPVRSDAPSDNTDGDPKAGNEDEKKKIKLNSKLHLQLSSLYSHALKHPLTLKLSSQPHDLDSIFDRIANDIHSGKLKPGEIDPDLVRWTATQLFEGVTQGYGSNLADYAEDSIDYNMLKHLKENVHVFSGFKTHAQLREATNLLTNAEGQIKSFAQFREDIMPLNKKFNEVYLQAEHQHAIAASQMAGNWVDIEAAADTLPNLTLITAGDDHVRPEHAILNGLTYPVNDPFWSTYYPPIDWGCRCDVLQSSDEVKKAHPGDLPKVKDMFAVNWGKDKIVFPDTHPYFDVSAEEKKNINDQLNKLK